MIWAARRPRCARCAALLIRSGINTPARARVRACARVQRVLRGCGSSFAGIEGGARSEARRGARRPRGREGRGRGASARRDAGKEDRACGVDDGTPADWPGGTVGGLSRQKGEETPRRGGGTDDQLGRTAEGVERRWRRRRRRRRADQQMRGRKARAPARADGPTDGGVLHTRVCPARRGPPMGSAGRRRSRGARPREAHRRGRGRALRSRRKRGPGTRPLRAADFVRFSCVMNAV